MNISHKEVKQLTQKLPSKSKYRNIVTYRCINCGSVAESLRHECVSCNSTNIHRFDSKKEAEHYDKCRIMQNIGQIKDLRIQVPYVFKHNNVRICTYFADFVYIDVETEKLHVVDVKGIETQVFKLKKKLMKAFYNIDIEIA